MSQQDLVDGFGFLERVINAEQGETFLVDDVERGFGCLIKHFEESGQEEIAQQVRGMKATFYENAFIDLSKMPNSNN